MIGQEVIYAPCPCGSGKKFKFCCYKKYRHMIDDDMTVAEIAQTVRCGESRLTEVGRADPESERLHDEGYVLMKRGRMAEAREKFRQSREAVPSHSASWNNEASCAWEMGEYAAACDIQREGNSLMTVADSFGLAMLALYAHVVGREEEAQRALADALAVPPVSFYGARQVCKTLALYRRHRDILEYAAQSGMADDPVVSYFTGTAHANLGEMEAAVSDFKRALDSDYGDRANRCIGMIGREEFPWAAPNGGAWPYFDSRSFRPARDMAADFADGGDPFARCPPSVIPDCIYFLQADGTISVDEAISLCRLTKGEWVENLAREFSEMLESERVVEEQIPEDVDAKGRPRVPFGFFENFGEETEEDEAWMEESYRLVNLDEPLKDPGFLQAENVLRDLSARNPDSLSLKSAHLLLVGCHDRELADGIWKSSHAENPDNARLAAIVAVMHVRDGNRAAAYEIFDHFSLPEPWDCRRRNLEWRAFVELLKTDPQTVRDRPDIVSRAKEFERLLDAGGE